MRNEVSMIEFEHWNRPEELNAHEETSRRVVWVCVGAPSVYVGVFALPTAATSLPPETTFQLSHLQSQYVCKTPELGYE